MINEGITKTLFDAYNFLEFLRNEFLRNSSRRSPAALTLEDATIPTHRGINLVDWCTLEPGSRISLQTPLFQEVKKVEKWERNSMVERERKKETRYLGVARENALSYTIPQPCNVAFTFQSFSINSRAILYSTRERAIFAKQSNRRNSMFHFRPSLFLPIFLPALKGRPLVIVISVWRERERESERGGGKVFALIKETQKV